MADEVLALGLYSRDVFDPDKNCISPEAIRIDDLFGNKGVHTDSCGDSSGLSMARVDQPAGQPELLKTLGEIAAKPKKNGEQRKVEGYATIVTSNLLLIERGALQVLDDGKPEYTTHAVVRACLGITKGPLRLVRNRLLEHLNRTVVRY